MATFINLGCELYKDKFSQQVPRYSGNIFVLLIEEQDENTYIQMNS